jgi:hypothetical protein
MNNGIQTNGIGDNVTSSTHGKNSVTKRKKDGKTQQLLNSSRKLGRRLISMDIESERRDNMRPRKSNQNT